MADDFRNGPRDNDPGRRHRPARVFGAVLALGAVLAVFLLALIPQAEPALNLDGPVQQAPTRIRQTVMDPVKSWTGNRQVKRFVLTADDLAVAANLALSRKQLRGAVRFHIERGRLSMVATIRLPEAYPRYYLNIHLVADDQPRQAIVKRLRIGRLSIPDPLIGWVVKGVLHLPPLSRYGELLENLVHEVHIADERVIVIVNWNREMLGELRGLLTGVIDRERMLAYHDKLADILNDGTQNRFVRLGTLMQPLFALAQARSLANQSPIEENRAVILVLSAYANGKDMGGALATDHQPPRRGVLLNKRIDTAKHYLGAAAMAMSGQGTLVEMIGLAKELHDTHDGSGFSFIDLAADEAGALFGKIAVRTPDKARQIQAILSQSADEAQFIPMLKDLPESLNSDEFASRFKTIGSPEYLAMKQQIRARIEALPLYQALLGG